MHGNNDKESRGNRVIPSNRFEKYTGPNKEIREQYRKEMQERSKPSSQLGSSSTTSAGSSKDKSK